MFKDVLDGKMWKEMVVAQFEALSRRLYGVKDKNKVIPLFV